MKTVALDTETTGLDLWHGCRAFMFGGCDEWGEIQLWRWRVDPLSREVIVPNSERLEIIDYLNSFDRYVFHNAKFDIRGLEFLGITFPPDFWSRVDDTILASHCLASAGPHDLKTLALRHLDILDDDEENLRTACIAARRIATKLGWRIAEPEDPHWPTTKTGVEWWKADCWLPGELVARADHQITPEQSIGETYEIDGEWSKVCERYARRDFERTLGLWLLFREELKTQGLWSHYEIRRRNLRTSYRQEARGMTVRRWLTESVRTRHEKHSTEHYQQCLKTVNHQVDNLESPKQLQSALYTILELPVIKRTEKSNAPSTDKEVLEKLRDRCRPHSRQAWFLKHLSGYRKRSHAAETILAYERGGLPFPGKKLNGEPNNYFCVLHPSINLTGTDTTRGSSTNPNGRNIAKGEGLPKEEGFNLRELFGPAPGRTWTTHDYSNIELRIFAYMAGEQEFLDAFEAGQSVHLLVAEELYPEIFAKLSDKEYFKKDFPHLYQWVKNGNFSLIYGAGVAKADATYHVQGAYKRIRKRFKHIDSFMRSTQREAARDGYVTTLGGYRLQIPDKAAHKAVNYKVQGSAGWAMMLAEARIDEYLDSMPGYHSIMEIYDELLHDIPDNYDPLFPYRIQELMERSGKDLGLPLPVEMAEIPISWDQEKDFPPLKLKVPLKPLQLSF